MRLLCLAGQFIVEISIWAAIFIVVEICALDGTKWYQIKHDQCGRIQFLSLLTEQHYAFMKLNAMKYS
jgi:hypothetical protein